MSIDQKVLDRIREENEKWVDDRFAPLDAPARIDLQKPGEDVSFHDPRFAPLADTGPAGRAELHRFLADPDAEAIERVAHETGDPELADRVRDDRKGQIAEQFVREHPDYYGSDDNFETMAAYMEQQELEWTVPNLERAFRELTSAGELESDPTRPRPISEADLRELAAQAANGDPLGAAQNYLRLRLSESVVEQIESADSYEQAMHFVADPAHKRIIEESVWFAFENSRTDYAPSAARRKFMREYMAGRFPTLTLLSAAWAACQQAERDQQRSALLGSPETEQPATAQDILAELDDLSDGEIRSLLQRTARAHARQVRQHRNITA